MSLPTRSVTRRISRSVSVVSLSLAATFTLAGSAFATPAAASTAVPTATAATSTADPAVVAAFQAVTGLTGDVWNRIAPALDLSHIGDLQLSDLGRKDQYGDLIPWGANHWDCKPSAEHPRPVIMVSGFNTKASLNGAAIAPVLKAAGYCVFTLNWGYVPGVSNFGQTRLAEGAKQLSAFVDQVLAATGTTRLDMIGHSAGGVMPRWYFNKLGGDKKVAKFFALAPATNGTDVDGLLTKQPELVKKFVDNMVSKGQTAVIDLLAGSNFIKEVNTPSPIRPTIEYRVLSSCQDFYVTPVKSQFLPAVPNVKNYLLQDLCPADIATHSLAAVHPVFFQMVENFLGNRNAPIVCLIVSPRHHAVQ